MASEIDNLDVSYSLDCQSYNVEGIVWLTKTVLIDRRSTCLSEEVARVLDHLSGIAQEIEGDQTLLPGG